MKFNVLQKKALGGIGAASLVVAGLFCAVSLIPSAQTKLSNAGLMLTPWATVGGCGAGGSGGGGGGAKWVGKGVAGGLVDVQIMTTPLSVGQNFHNSSVSTRLSMKPRWDTQIGLSIPVVSKSGEVQPTTLLDPKFSVTTGGMGDLGLDISQSLGMEGQYSVGLAVSLPTAQYNIKRGSDKVSTILPSGLQKGSGLYGVSLALGYTKDVKDGIWLVDAGYSHPMAMRLFTGENEFNKTWFKYSYAADSTLKDDKRFFYRFKPYGENDLGDYTPPSVSLSCYFGYKGVANYMHSWGVTLGAPLGIAWVHDESVLGTVVNYNPRPDTDHKTWSATFNYGIEFSSAKYPLFAAVSLPFHAKSAVAADKKAPGSEFAPDWKDFGQQWSFFVGVKSTMF